MEEKLLEKYNKIDQLREEIKVLEEKLAKKNDELERVVNTKIKINGKIKIKDNILISKHIGEMEKFNTKGEIVSVKNGFIELEGYELTAGGKRKIKKKLYWENLSHYADYDIVEIKEKDHK